MVCKSYLRLQLGSHPHQDLPQQEVHVSASIPILREDANVSFSMQRKAFSHRQVSKHHQVQAEVFPRQVLEVGRRGVLANQPAHRSAQKQELLCGKEVEFSAAAGSWGKREVDVYWGGLSDAEASGSSFVHHTLLYHTHYREAEIHLVNAIN